MELPEYVDHNAKAMVENVIQRLNVALFLDLVDIPHVDVALNLAND